MHLVSAGCLWRICPFPVYSSSRYHDTYLPSPVAPSHSTSARVPPSYEAIGASNPASERSSRHSRQQETHMVVSSFPPDSDQSCLLMCQSNCSSWCFVPHHCDYADSINPTPVTNRVESVSVPIWKLWYIQEGRKIPRAAVKEREVYSWDNSPSREQLWVLLLFTWSLTGFSLTSYQIKFINGREHLERLLRYIFFLHLYAKMVHATFFGPSAIYCDSIVIIFIIVILKLVLFVFLIVYTTLFCCNFFSPFYFLKRKYTHF